jgi:hypothetical protein
MPTPKCAALDEPSKSTIHSAQGETSLFWLHLCNRNIGTVFLTQQPNAYLGRLIVEVSRPHTIRHTHTHTHTH